MQEGPYILVPGEEVSWSSFCGLGGRNVLVSAGGLSTIGHPQRRQAAPGPHPGRGLSGMSLLKHTHTHMTIRGGRGRAAEPQRI